MSIPAETARSLLRTEALREPARRRDWVFYLAAGAVILALANGPTIAGYIMPAPEDAEFIGTMDPNYGDLFYHLSFGTQAARGHLLLEQKYNGDKVRTRWLVNVLALATGGLMALGLSVEAASHVLRNAVAAGTLLVLYLLCGQVLLRRSSRRLAFLVAALGSGLAWLLNSLAYLWSGPMAMPVMGWTLRRGPRSPLHPWTLDGRLLELSSFRLISAEFVAPAVVLLILIFWLQFPRPGTWRTNGRVLLLGLIPLLIGLVHPHDMVNVGATVVLLLLWGLASARRPPWITPRLLLLGLPAAPLYLLHLFMMQNEPVLAFNFQLKDPVGTLAIFVGLGLPGLVAAARLPWLLGADWPVRVLALAAATCLLLFAVKLPNTGQWYNIHGLQVFVSLLAVTAIERIRAPRWRRAGQVVVAAMVLLAPGNAVMNMIEDVCRAAAPGSPYFRARDLNTTLAWMYRSLPMTSVVLTDLETVMAVPHRTGCRVAIGMPEQTAGFRELAGELEAWKKRPADPELPFLRKLGISHILMTPALARGMAPEKLPDMRARGQLRAVHVRGKYSVYEVVMLGTAPQRGQQGQPGVNGGA